MELRFQSPGFGDRTVRKVQVRIIPLIVVLYVVAFLDRINITFAALTMNAELGLPSQQYGLLAVLFFVGYFVFEIPSNLLLYRFGARPWIARILVSWGVLAALTGLALAGACMVGAAALLLRATRGAGRRGAKAESSSGA